MPTLRLHLGKIGHRKVLRRGAFPGSASDCKLGPLPNSTIFRRRPEPDSLQVLKTSLRFLPVTLGEFSSSFHSAQLVPVAMTGQEHQIILLLTGASTVREIRYDTVVSRMAV